MVDTTSWQRRRKKIEERVAGGDLRATLDRESPTWIPTPYVVGMVAATCHYCTEPIGPEETLLVRDSATCHAECEEAWRGLVTGERGE